MVSIEDEIKKKLDNFEKDNRNKDAFAKYLEAFGILGIYNIAIGSVKTDSRVMLDLFSRLWNPPEGIVENIMWNYSNHNIDKEKAVQQLSEARSKAETYLKMRGYPPSSCNLGDIEIRLLEKHAKEILLFSS